jgi:vitamin B12 transporter
MGLKFSLAGILCAGTALCGGAFAQEAATDTVVIDATRLGQTEVEAGTAISIIEGEDLSRRALSQAADALAIAPGVTVSQSGAFGGIAYARIRGNNAVQTLVLVDGVPVNDVASPGGGYDFATLDLADVDRIEVLRGPQSTLWGSDAIGGVISIVTRAPGPGLGWRGFMEAGSFATLRAGGSISGGGDRADGRLSAVWNSSEGISTADEQNGNTEKDGFDSFSISGRGGVNLSSTVRLDGTLRWVNAEFDFDGFPPPLFELADTSDRTQSEDLSGSANLTAETFGGRLTNVLQITHASLDRSNYDDALLTSENKGERTGYRYAGDATLAVGNRLVFGAEREESKANGEEAEANGVFALYEWQPVSTVTLTGGIRYDDDDRYGSETTGRAAASWNVADSVRLRATWGQGFKAPTIFQSTFICGFCGLTEPNSNLKAETSEAYDVGIDFALGNIDVSLTAFDQETENLIDFSFTEGFANIALAKSRGVEVEIAAPLTSWLEVRAAYAYIDAEDGDGEELPRVPEQSGDAELIFTPQGPFSASIAVRHNGDQSDGFGPRVPAWTRTDLAATWRLSRQAELYGRIENLFDEDYQSVGGYGTPGVSGLVGIRVRN